MEHGNAENLDFRVPISLLALLLSEMVYGRILFFG